MDAAWRRKIKRGSSYRSSGSSSFCGPSDCYAVTCGGGAWQGEVSWDLVDTNGVVILSGGAPYSDSLCFPVILGCMNPLADNYDATANYDDGSCTYPCLTNEITWNMYDSFGDGWNGATYTLADAYTGAVVATVV